VEVVDTHELGAVGVEAVEDPLYVARVHVVLVERVPQPLCHVVVVGVAHEDHEVGVRDGTVAVEVDDLEELVLLRRGEAEAKGLESVREVLLGDLVLPVHVEVAEGLLHLARLPPLELLLDQLAQPLLVPPDLAVARAAGGDRVQHLEVAHLARLGALERDLEVLHLDLGQRRVESAQRDRQVGRAHRARVLLVRLLEDGAVVDAARDALAYDFAQPLERLGADGALDRGRAGGGADGDGGHEARGELLLLAELRMARLEEAEELGVADAPVVVGVELVEDEAHLVRLELEAQRLERPQQLALVHEA